LAIGMRRGCVSAGRGRGVMELLVTGSGTAVPSVRRCAAGYSLAVAGQRLQIDSGPGTMRQLARFGIAPEQVDCLCYTHTHPDHVADLVPFLFASRYGQTEPRTRPLAVVGGRGFGAFLAAQQAVYGHWLEPDGFALHLHELATDGADRWAGDGFCIASRPMRHIATSVGLRVEEVATGRSICFSGDTEFTDELVRLAAGTDLLVCECANPEAAPMAGHLIPSQAGRIAAASGCKALLLTHFYPPCDEADLITPLRRHYAGPLMLAEDGLRVVV